MASQDVIELGSSDDEPEPPPKKRKPLPNAMVHIPIINTIVSKKQVIENVQKKLAGKPVTVKLVEKQKQSRPNLIKVNPLAKPKTNFSNSSKNRHVLKTPINIVNGLSFSSASSSKSVKSANNPLHILRKPMLNLQSLPKSTQVLRFQKPKILPNLPAGITIKKKPVMRVARKNPVKPGNVMQNTGFQKFPIEYPLVQLDCEDPLQGVPGPQWYLNPEESSKVKSIEEQNNAEPKAVQIFEITIEDSPIKPSSKNRMHEVGTELAITIEDSPVKPSTANNLKNDSDEDISMASNRKKHSKKQLRYPKETEVVEIEIEPLNIDDERNVIENEFDHLELNCLSTQKHVSSAIKPKFEEKEAPKLDEPNDDVKTVDNSKENTQFHPVYQNFIDLCFKLENSEDMKKIVEKKIKSYYRQVPREYRESEEFIDMVSSKILAMQAGPEKMYLYIKDVVDELNVQRKMAQAQSFNKTPHEKTETDKPWYEDAAFDNKRQRQIRKLEKTLKKLHRAIQKLEEQEVDFDDDEDSVYLLTERYKERLVRVHAKFCQLTNTKMPSEPRIHIEARPGRPTGPAQRLEKWINKKVPIGTPLPFPDFHDVLKCVRDANIEDKLYWNEADIMDEARDLFTRCGKKLQRRRQENEWRLAASRISAEADPSENSEELRKKLENNRKTAAKKESEVLNKFADKQNLLKLEAIEINDKEADDSPIESEEDDFNDENTALKSKERRKERLKRLIEEKSKRVLNENIENKKSITDDSLISEKEKPENKSLESDVIDKKEVTTTSNGIKLNANDQTKLQIGETKEKVVQCEVLDCRYDDSNKLDSDIDELNLLQKLHSENEINSSPDSSSDTPDNLISISDSSDGGSEDDYKCAEDVISIENSSVSESETNIEDKDIQDENKKEIVVTQNEIIENNKNETDNNDVQNEFENILLASSDDDDVSVNKLDNTNSLNLLDDNISMHDTVFSETQTVKENEKELERKSKNICISENLANSEDIENQNKTTKSNENMSVCELETSKNPDIIRISDKEKTIKSHIETVSNYKINNRDNIEIQHSEVVNT